VECERGVCVGWTHKSHCKDGVDFSRNTLLCIFTDFFKRVRVYFKKIFPVAMLHTSKGGDDFCPTSR